MSNFLSLDLNLNKEPRGLLRHQPTTGTSQSGNMANQVWSSNSSSKNQAEGSCSLRNQETLMFVLRGTRTVQMSEELELLLFQTHEQQHLHGQLERRINPSMRWVDEKSYDPQETDAPL